MGNTLKIFVFFIAAVLFICCACSVQSEGEASIFTVNGLVGSCYTYKGEWLPASSHILMQGDVVVFSGGLNTAGSSSKESFVGPHDRIGLLFKYTAGSSYHISGRRLMSSEPRGNYAIEYSLNGSKCGISTNSTSLLRQLLDEGDLNGITSLVIVGKIGKEVLTILEALPTLEYLEYLTDESRESFRELCRLPLKWVSRNGSLIEVSQVLNLGVPMGKIVWEYIQAQHFTGAEFVSECADRNRHYIELVLEESEVSEDLLGKLGLITGQLQLRLKYESSETLRINVSSWGIRGSVEKYLGISYKDSVLLQDETVCKTVDIEGAATIGLKRVALFGFEGHSASPHFLRVSIQNLSAIKFMYLQLRNCVLSASDGKTLSIEVVLIDDMSSKVMIDQGYTIVGATYVYCEQSARVLRCIKNQALKVLSCRGLDVSDIQNWEVRAIDTIVRVLEAGYYPAEVPAVVKKYIHYLCRFENELSIREMGTHRVGVRKEGVTITSYGSNVIWKELVPEYIDRCVIGPPLTLSVYAAMLEVEK